MTAIKQGGDMKDEWWYALDGARKGPVKFEVLRGKVFDGSLSATDLVWTAGMSKWTAISDVPALQEFLQALPPELPKTAAPRPPEPFAATEPTPLVASVPTPELAGPWRRLCARLIDLWVIGLPTVFLVAFFLAPVWPGFALWLQQPRADIALGIFSIPLVLVVESVIFGVFGTTLGKWLLGVHIETLTSRQLWFMDYLFRQTGVYWYGLGVGFPVVNLFTMAWQYGRLKSDRAASYDEGLYKATSRKVSVIRYVFAVLLIFVMIILNGVFDLLNRSYYQKNAASNTHSPVSIEQQPIVNTPQPPVVNSTGDASPPRHNSCRLLRTQYTGAAMKEFCGTLRTIIQGPGSSSAVAT
jgi:hypothetical protein